MECRLCLCSATTETSVPIVCDSDPLAKHIQNCCQLQMTNWDQPQRICLTCESNVEQFADFKKTCVQNDETSRRRLSEFMNIKVEEVMLEDDLILEEAAANDDNEHSTGVSKKKNNSIPSSSRQNIEPQSLPTFEDLGDVLIGRKRQLGIERVKHWQAQQKKQKLESIEQVPRAQLEEIQQIPHQVRDEELYVNNMIEDPTERVRRLAEERQDRWRTRQSQEALEIQEVTEAKLATRAYCKKLKHQIPTPELLEARKLARAHAQRVRLQTQTPEQIEARRAARVRNKTLRLQSQTPEEIETRRAAHALSQRLRLQSLTPEQAEARRAAQARSKRLRLQLQSPEQAEARRAAHARSERIRLQSQTPEQIEARRVSHARSERLRLLSQTPEQIEARRVAHARSERLRLQSQTPEQIEARRIAHACSERLRFQSQEAEDLTIQMVIQSIKNGEILDETLVTEHSCGMMNIICQFCASRNFEAERPPDGKFNSCCRKGKVKLLRPEDEYGNAYQYPDFLRQLLSNPEHPYYKHFRDNIRSYNSAVSFATLGAKVADFQSIPPSVFKIHGQIYHRTTHIRSADSKAPQLYVIDNAQATVSGANEQCFPLILDEIDCFFSQNNTLVNNYRTLRDLEARAVEENGMDIPIVNVVFKRGPQSEPQRQYNSPNTDEIAMVFINKDGEPPFKRDIRAYPLNPEHSRKQHTNLGILSSNLDPMLYPLLFPYGEAGWQPNWRCNAYEGAKSNRERVTMLQYKAAQMAIRDEFNPLMSAGKLTQQWIVDSYTQIEANNLNFMYKSQKQTQTGNSDVLPSSFEESARNTRERCADAMSIFAKLGAPDLHIIFTANPEWSEITDNLQVGEKPSDRPDLIARIFKIKLKALLKDVTVRGVLGNSVNYVYTIEFQSGLPLAHILMTLQAADKFTNADCIDRVVFAEIPDRTKCPRLYDIVTKCMMHGPCGLENPAATCMENGKCRNNYPKEFQTSTVQDFDGYPLYRRRSTPTVQVRGTTTDNRYVVPYNPYLLMKYNARINVEVCTSMRAVKHIYKHIYKGYNCTDMIITASKNPQSSKIKQVANYRYVSPSEAIWRILESSMHGRSHAVVSLPVHLPNQQETTYEDDSEGESDEETSELTKLTKLQAWFNLNASDPDAHSLFYTDIPRHYRYAGNKWQRRKQTGEKILSRMFSVGIGDEEQYYLRLMLLHVPGATSFEYIRTVDDITYDTFERAAFHSHLLASDEEWDQCLREMSMFNMPLHMRQTFAYICYYCMPTNVNQLWMKYSQDMSFDYQGMNYEARAINLALHNINSMLEQRGLSCAAIGLPLPMGNSVDILPYDRIQEQQEAQRQIQSLNAEQLEAFRKIVHGIDGKSETNTRCFYLDGPAGSGKTYLYSTLLSFVRGRGNIALSYAATEIAATLLNGGEPVASGFKLPVSLLENSTSSMRINSPEAEMLRRASVIIIDEITMLTKHGLGCIDKLLREIMENQQPFGGKVMVIGGDFRQTLPIVRNNDVIDSCIKSSPLWQHFKILKLTANMRSSDQDDHNAWILNVGSGNMPNIADLPCNSIEIPQHMIDDQNLIDTIYGQNIRKISIHEIAKRVILASTTEETLEINRTIIEKLPGRLHVFYSADSIESEDPDDAINYPPEFLYNQTPSGMPPHKLELKVGTIVMLLRNLNPKRGLCSGKRLVIKSLQNNFITAEIFSGNNRGDVVFLPRIDFSPADVNLPFFLKRRQFPIIPAYAITIDKSRGQTFDYVGIHLNEPVFTHGQLYTALSRCRKPLNIKIHIKENRLQGKLLKNDKIFTQNIVNGEISYD